MINKRTRTELLSLVLLLALGAWLLHLHIGTSSPPPPTNPDPSPTPRVQDFMRRPPEDPGIHPLQPDQPLDPSRASDKPPEPEDTPLTLLVVHVTDPDGALPPGHIEIFTPENSFRHPVNEGRAALDVPPGTMRLQALLEDEYGTRLSDILHLELEPGETVSAVLEIPFPDPADPGFRLLPRDGYAEVTEVLPNTPADTAGMEPGDAVLSIDGIATDGLTEDQLNHLLFGLPGEPLSLLLILPDANGELHELEAQLLRE